MIPDFKTYIKESVWSDIHKRSNGETVRKEDDINQMSAEGLYNYIKDTYLFKSTYDILVDEKEGRIVIDLYDVGGRNCYLSLNDMNGEKYIVLSDLYTKHMKDLLDAYYHVGERSFANSSLDDFIIRPKDDGEITNKFFIEVLDFLIDNADNKHTPNLYPANKFRKNESVWSDIHKRSNGSSVRKEDILKDIYVYLTSKYNTTYSEDKIELDDEGIYIPIFKFYGTYASLRIYRDNIYFSAINPNKYMDAPVKKMKDKLNTFYGDLADNYSAKIEEFTGARDFWYTFELKPLGKEGTVTKEFCTDVIDFILESIDDKITKILKKKI